MTSQKVLFPDRTFDTGTVRVALRTYDPGHQLIREHCPDGQLWFTLVGKWMVRQDGRRRDVGSDDVQYYAPRQPAGREVATPVVAVGVQLRPTMLQGVDLHRPLSIAARQSLIQASLRALVNPDESSLDESIWTLLSQSHQATEPDAGVAQRIRTLLHDEPDGHRSIAEVARCAGCHPAYAANVFRKAYGCSISTYRRQLRTKAALTRLQAGTPFSRAMIEAGFYDAAHFHRVFRAEFGVALAALRKSAA